MLPRSAILKPLDLDQIVAHGFFWHNINININEAVGGKMTSVHDLHDIASISSDGNLVLEGLRFIIIVSYLGIAAQFAVYMRRVKGTASTAMMLFVMVFALCAMSGYLLPIIGGGEYLAISLHFVLAMVAWAIMATNRIKYIVHAVKEYDQSQTIEARRARIEEINTEIKACALAMSSQVSITAGEKRILNRLRPIPTETDPFPINRGIDSPPLNT